MFRKHDVINFRPANPCHLTSTQDLPKDLTLGLQGQNARHAIYALRTMDFTAWPSFQSKPRWVGLSPFLLTHASVSWQHSLDLGSTDMKILLTLRPAQYLAQDGAPRNLCRAHAWPSKRGLVCRSWLRDLRQTMAEKM